MPDKPDDRPKSAPTGTTEEPRLFIVVGQDKFPRPGLETYFADPGAASPGSAVCSCHPVVGTYCSCNKVSVCSCVPVCTCQSVCSCVGHTVPVCSCQSVGKSCSCVGHVSGGGGTVVTGCRCAPVH